MTRSALVSDHLPLVYSLARDFHRRSPSHAFDDLVSAGAVGLCEAARRFQRDRAVTFGTFAWYRIRGAIIDWMRTDGPYSRGAVAAYRRGEAPTITVGLADVGSLPDERPRADELLIAAREVAAARARIDAMPDKPRRLMTLMYGPRDMNLPAASRAIGASKGWACRLRQQAIRELRAAAEAA
jgi:RNA polymerase sigma factor (sigma-70 family)